MQTEVTGQLAALAHPKRLDVFRLLMRRYPDQVPAGEIAESLALKANTASTYLGALRQAGLIDQERRGVSLRYQANVAAMQGLSTELFSGCCQNRPDTCLQAGELVDQPLKANPPYNVLFICTGNSARSILAEAILNQIGGENFSAYSAGIEPSEAPRPEVLQLLKEKGYDVGALRSQSIDDFAAQGADHIPVMDFVFTVCDHAANEQCPTWPGQPMSAHWGLPDPARADGSDAQKMLAYQQTYGLLLNRLKAFVSLPLETIDRMSLQHSLDDIGRAKPGADTPENPLNSLTESKN